MPIDDPMIQPSSTTTLPAMTSVYPETILPPPPKEPNRFLKVLGGIAGGAASIVAPGLGGILGSVIGGGSSSYGSYGALVEQQKQFDEMQRYSQIANSLNQRQQQTMMNQQQQQSMQLIGIQHQVGMQSQEFSTVSNLMKTRHDSEMTAVNNIKS